MLHSHQCLYKAQRLSALLSAVCTEIPQDKTAIISGPELAENIIQ